MPLNETGGPPATGDSPPQPQAEEATLGLRNSYGKILICKSKENVSVRITQKGQVTIPADVRERFGLLPETEIDFIVEGNTVKLVKAHSRDERNRGAKILRRLQGSATVRLTTDQIMALTRKR